MLSKETPNEHGAAGAVVASPIRFCAACKGQVGYSYVVLLDRGQNGPQSVCLCMQCYQDRVLASTAVGPSNYKGANHE